MSDHDHSSPSRRNRAGDWTRAHPDVMCWATTIALYLVLRFSADAPRWAALGFAIVIFLLLQERKSS